MEKSDERLWSWASELDPQTEEQARATASLPVVDGHVALMPDAHLGMGATIGSVIPTAGAVIPSAVGVDIGCGMAARRLDLTTADVDDPARLRAWVDAMATFVPAGLGHWFDTTSERASAWLDENPPPDKLEDRERIGAQLGTLGSGNHFVELVRDEDDRIWILLHSGSRGAGNRLATFHTEVAIRTCPGPVPHRDLSWLSEGTPAFDDYIRDLMWSQGYARENRRLILAHTQEALEASLGHEVAGTEEINCHHNYTALETHGDRTVWVTRKGAIRAGEGELGLVPGSMGQRSYVVRGRGSEASYASCSHGAGRRMSRTKARKALSLDEFVGEMHDVVWQDRDARALIDEAPGAYKPIDQVMRDQADLVEVVHELHAVANYKGTDERRARG
jgi:tRNA-splicing ligase RtcB